MTEQREPDLEGDEELAPGGAETVSAAEALTRAREHGRIALREALCAVRWLVEAGSLAASGAPSVDHRWLGSLTALIESAELGLQGDGSPVASRVLEAIATALEQEIARWERRGRDDPEARAVLRAFLGLRELLWEFGVRPPESPEPERRGSPRRPRSPNGRGRFERVPVEG